MVSAFVIVIVRREHVGLNQRHYLPLIKIIHIPSISANHELRDGFERG